MQTFRNDPTKSPRTVQITPKKAVSMGGSASRVPWPSPPPGFSARMAAKRVVIGDLGSRTVGRCQRRVGSRGLDSSGRQAAGAGAHSHAVPRPPLHRPHRLLAVPPSAHHGVRPCGASSSPTSFPPHSAGGRASGTASKGSPRPAGAQDLGRTPVLRRHSLGHLGGECHERQRGLQLIVDRLIDHELVGTSWRRRWYPSRSASTQTRPRPGAIPGSARHLAPPSRGSSLRKRGAVAFRPRSCRGRPGPLPRRSPSRPRPARPPGRASRRASMPAPNSRPRLDSTSERAPVRRELTPQHALDVDAALGAQHHESIGREGRLDVFGDREVRRVEVGPVERGPERLPQETVPVSRGARIENLYPAGVRPKGGAVAR